MPDELQVKALLRGKLLQKFNEIKEYYKIEADAEVFRLCISDAYRVLQERKNLSNAISSENVGAE